MLVFKILTEDEHAAFLRDSRFEGSDDDRRDGFVHLSTGPQVAETARRHFAGHYALTVLACEADALGEALKWEPSRDGAWFPHLYRPLEAGDVAWSAPLIRDADGNYRLPEDTGP